MKKLSKLVVLVSAFLISFTQFASAWTPSKEVEIVAHAKETSSTVAFARAVIKVIDSRGRVVREYSNIISNNIIIKKKELSPGLYNIILKLNDNIIKKSIIIQ